VLASLVSSILQYIYVLLAWTSARNTFRPATFTSILDTYSTLLSDFNFANPCYQILSSKLHFISWAKPVHRAVIPHSIGYHTSHWLPLAITTWESLILYPPTRRTETRRSCISIITSRITESPEMHGRARLWLAYIGDVRSQSVSPIIKLIRDAH
jgi:hypothetical protein